MKGNGLKVSVLVYWMINALIHGIIPYYICYPFYGDILGDNNSGLYIVGVIVYTVMFIIGNLKVF